MHDRLEDRFGDLVLIGEGAMGTVYSAQDLRQKRRVALKVMNAALAANPEAMTRFEREFTGLVHPNIVAVYEFVKLSGNLCLVMELIPGKSLERAIEDRWHLTVEQKVQLMASVCRALDFAHREGRIHRDLKPSNIMLRPDGTPKIIDFGIAKKMNEKLTRTNAHIGTIAYMAPEQINGKPVDGRTDVFSVGVVLYELLTGVSPFNGEDTIATMRMILMDPTPKLPDDIPGIPERLHKVLEQALAKDPKDRYQTAMQLAEALEHSIAPVEPRVPPTPPTPQRSVTPPPVKHVTPPPVKSQGKSDPGAGAAILGVIVLLIILGLPTWGIVAAYRYFTHRAPATVYHSTSGTTNGNNTPYNPPITTPSPAHPPGSGGTKPSSTPNSGPSKEPDPSPDPVPKPPPPVRRKTALETYNEGLGKFNQGDYTEAAGLFQSACDAKNRDSCEELGDMYARNIGVGQDYGKSLILYSQACTLGSGKSCSSLGHMYRYGQGVAVDEGKARTYFDLACHAGNTTACQSGAKP
jgi:eukaryotic-like serine/threonine-protein kinase